VGEERGDGFDFDGDAGGDDYGLLLSLLERLDAARVRYTVRAGPESIRVDVSVRAERWEIRFKRDGTVDVERFRAVGGVGHDPALLDEIFGESG
jgi:hypothetical protein